MRKKKTVKRQVRKRSETLTLLRIAQASLKESPEVVGVVLKVLAKKLRAELNSRIE